MQRERVSENVYWFQSDVYAQVTAGVITGLQWAVVIDTLAIPDETLAMRSYIEEDLNVPVRYIINTHSHADHTWGNCFFPGATIIAHSLCRKAMLDRGQAALDAAKKQNPIFKQIKIVPPHLTFDRGEISLRVGKKNLVITSTPGHSTDGISVLVEEDRVLFAGDAFLPLPYIVDGDLDELSASVKNIGKMGLENIIQGHGDIILRGEIENAVRENLNYLSCLRRSVRSAIRRRNSAEALAAIDIDSCGKSRVYLGGLAEELHRRNLRHLYRRMVAEEGETPAATSQAAADAK
ncbi:MAG: MBL fold metallo-hydrolase [Anaerolineaceae bacterium]|jgi:glyoxylase-like metal-dependent hydrolase (beta-lactamase superfamily II)